MCRGASHGSRSSLIRLLAIVAFFATLLTTPSRLALAATKNVDIGNSSCNDGTGVPAFCHIQPAITAANPGDQISIAAGTYFENLSISKNISVSATSTDAAQTIVDGNGTDQPVVLIGVGVTVDISNVTIRNANHVSGEAGGIANQGTLTLSNVIVRDNFAGNGGSGIDNLGTITILNSLIENNRTAPGAGSVGVANSGTATISATRISKNSGSDAVGIKNNPSGVMVLNNGSIVDENISTGNGGGIRNDGMLTLDQAAIKNNTAGVAGAGIFNLGTLLITNKSIISGNKANGFAGGIHNDPLGKMTINDSAVSGNSATSTSSAGNTNAGGINNDGIATLTDSIVQDNTASNTSTPVGSTIDSVGGGIVNSRLITLTNSLVSRNTASAPRSGEGGGIANGTVSGRVILINSTVSENRASGTVNGLGGGILNGVGNNGIVTILNSTINGNAVSGGSNKGGGISNEAGGTVTLQNSIVAANASAASADCEGNLISQGYNLIGNATNCALIPAFGDQAGTAVSPIDPQLGPLQDNDGPTPTQALLPGSPALDAGNPAQPGSGGAACLVTDQRGVSRPAGARCDIGAYEAIPLGQVGTLVGTPGVPGAANGPGPVAQFNGPSSISLNRDSTIALIADTQNSTIRKLEVTAGVASTMAGLAGQIGSTDGITTEARFNHPQGVALSRDGSFGLVADTGNHTIRKVIVATGHVTRLAGFPGLAGSDNGTGDAARFNLPTGVALSGDGSFALVADNGNHTIRKLIVATGEVTTLAGSPGNPGKSDGVGAEATFTSPSDLGLSANGKIALVAEGDGDLATGQTMTGLRVRKIETATGRVTTVTILSACNSIRIQANSGRIMGIAPTGDASVVLVANGLNGTILAVTVATGESRLVAGSECVPGADNGVGSAARFRNPLGIALTSNGSTALVADTENHTIRRIDGVLQRRFLSILLR